MSRRLHRVLRSRIALATVIATVGAGLGLLQAPPARALPTPRCLDAPAILPVAAGAYSTYALARDGSEWSWGDDSHGQIGNGTTGSFPSPVNASGFSGIEAVSAGAYHVLVLRQDATVWAWGDDTYGQLGDGNTGSSGVPVPNHAVPGFGTNKIVAISAGGNDSYAVTSTGAVWAWGNNGYGQIGDGSTQTRPNPVPITAISGVKQISTDPGGQHTLALTNSGQVYAWGNASQGSNGPNAVLLGQTPTPTLVPMPVGVVPVAVSSGYNHSVVLAQSGAVYVFGSDAFYQLGDNTQDSINPHPNPVAVPGLTAVNSISAGLFFTLASKTDGTVVGWGDDFFGQDGDGGNTYATTPHPTQNLAGTAAVAAGQYGAIASTTAGQVKTWGSNNFGRSATAQPTPITPTRSEPRNPSC
jgi:alpha-tubulin suppressor-like RCC1 family protein